MQHFLSLIAILEKLAQAIGHITATVPSAAPLGGMMVGVRNDIEAVRAVIGADMEKMTAEPAAVLAPEIKPEDKPQDGPKEYVPPDHVL